MGARRRCDALPIRRAPADTGGRVASVAAMNAVPLLERRRLYGRVLLVGLCCAVLLALSSSTGSTPLVSAAVSSQEAEALRHYDRGVYVHYCPANEEAASIASYRSKVAQRARVAMASHAGWPPDDCLKMDKG